LHIFFAYAKINGGMIVMPTQKNKNIIAKLRKENKMSQMELGKLLEVGQTTISSWELSKTEPDYASLEKMANIFKKSIDLILGYYDSEEMEQKALKENEQYHSQMNAILDGTMEKESLAISQAIVFMDKDQRERLLSIAKSAFPNAFNLAEQRLRDSGADEALAKGELLS
jgi:transcriptional regulator with XRE-family HTH domain